MGKSRIIAAIVTIVLKACKKDLRAVYIAFSSPILLKTDQAVYEKLQLTLQLPIHLTVGFDDVVERLTKADLLILDEADYHLLDELKDLPLKTYGVIGMTATDVGKTGGNEEKRLQ